MLQGSYGAWLQGGSNNTLRGLRLRDLGSGGMRIGEGSIPSAQNSIVDCSIRDGGHVFFAGAGIHATRTDGNLIEGNTIAGFAASGVIIRIGAGNVIRFTGEDPSKYAGKAKRSFSTFAPTKT